MGLLLLRATAGGAVAIHAGLYLARVQPGLTSWLLGCLAFISGIGLIVGFVTPAAAGVAGVSVPVIAGGWIGASDPEFPVTAITLALVVSNAVSLALLGPGAYSIDARLFGRREIIIQSEGARQ